MGQKLNDLVVGALGSWRFLAIQTVVVLCWMALNVGVVVRHWDPYPFILLNLLFSTQAAYASPLILMSQNYQSRRDRERDDREAGEVDELLRTNRRQLELVEEIRGALCP